MITYDILIPAYNASATLPELFSRVRSLKPAPANTFCVDDGSTDGTGKSDEFKGIKLVRLPKRRGKGFALRTGFSAFLQDSNSELLICLDADLQHPVEQIPRFLDSSEKYGSRILIGNREKNFHTMPIMRVFSNRITSFILSRLSGQHILDSQCGYRLIHREVLERLNLHENGFQLETEFILEAVKLNYQIDFIPIPTIYNGHPSNINHLVDTWRFIKLIAKEIGKR